MLHILQTVLIVLLDANKKVMHGVGVVGKLVKRVWGGMSGTGATTWEPEILRAALGTLARLVDGDRAVGVDDEFREHVGN